MTMFMERVDLQKSVSAFRRKFTEENETGKTEMMNYGKRHNKFPFPSLAEAIYESFYKVENEIFNAVNYNCNPQHKCSMK